MAFEQYFVQEWKSSNIDTSQSTESEKNSACFDCNICLEFACDPVVTLCGHLYCWPCIYKWFDSQRSSDKLPLCPICNSKISERTMVPLYGRGGSFSDSEPESRVNIPPRPPACGTRGVNNINRELFNIGGDVAGAIALYQPGVFGEMVYARVFRNSESLYTYPNSYQSVVTSAPRVRRHHELQVDESLHRVTVFLFCFLFLCLVVF